MHETRFVAGLNADVFSVDFQVVSLFVSILLYMKSNVRFSEILGILDGCIANSDDFLQQKPHGYKGCVFGIDYDVLFPYFQASFGRFHPTGGWDERCCKRNGATQYNA
jgi:hypothetical protein